METPKQESKPLIEPKRTFKSYLIETLICFTILCVATVGIACIDVYARLISFQFATLRVLGDAFGVSGLSAFCFWGLMWVAGEGAFDMIVYSVRKVFNVTFQHLIRNPKLPKTYTEYVELRRQKKKNHFFPLLATSGLFFTVGLILSILAVI
jgi:nitrate reductase NapE component